MRIISAAILIVFVAGCSGPFFLLPGGALAGAEVPLNTANMPTEEAVLQLETNPSDPYSVNVGFRLIDGQIYIDPAIERQWYQHLQADSNVRIRFTGAEVVHRATAEVVTDAKIIANFDSDRIVMRLVPQS